MPTLSQMALRAFEMSGKKASRLGLSVVELSK